MSIAVSAKTGLIGVISERIPRLVNYVSFLIYNIVNVIDHYSKLVLR